MASLNILMERGEVCRCLRSKTMYYDAADLVQPENEEGGPFWCSMTASMQGPDGGVVDVKDCRPSRSCCETL